MQPPPPPSTNLPCNSYAASESDLEGLLLKYNLPDAELVCVSDLACSLQSLQSEFEALKREFEAFKSAAAVVTDSVS